MMSNRCTREVNMNVRAWLRSLSEVKRFIVVGGGIAAVQTILLWLFVAIVGFEKVAANRVLQPIALIVSFFLHREVTWEEKKGRFLRDAIFYFLSRGIVAGFNVLIFELLVTVPWIPYVVINPALVGIEAVLNFLAGKVIYRKKMELA